MDCDKFFERDNNDVTRNNGVKLKGKRFQTNVAKNFFTYKIINEWNALPSEVVTATSVNMFKNRLDKILKSRLTFP